MALAPLNWRMLTPVTLQVASVNGLLDVIYAMGTSTTYADGSARVPGTGSAWTWTRDQANAVQPGVTTACIGVPPINALNMGYIIAGSTGSPASGPTMNTDTYTATTPIVGMNKNGGVYTTWTNALPFTSGQFSGFVSGARGGYNVAGTIVYIWESQEATIISLGQLSGNSTLFGMGALIDPLSSAAANSESDGCLYSIFTTGRTSNLSNIWLSDGTTTNTPMFGAAINSNSHWYTFNVGAVSTTRLTLRAAVGVSYSAQTLSSGAPVLLPWQMMFSPSTYAGQLRNIYQIKAAALGQVWQAGGVVSGYTVAASPTATNDAMLMQY